MLKLRAIKILVIFNAVAFDHIQISHKTSKLTPNQLYTYSTLAKYSFSENKFFFYAIVLLTKFPMKSSIIPKVFALLN